MAVPEWRPDDQTGSRDPRRGKRRHSIDEGHSPEMEMIKTLQ